LYKVLGEIEARENQFSVARDIFAKGLSQDSNCAPLYHAAALLEAKLGNLGVTCKITSLYLKLLFKHLYVYYPGAF
jgi:hypothetical protein